GPAAPRSGSRSQSQGRAADGRGRRHCIAQAGLGHVRSRTDTAHGDHRKAREVVRCPWSGIADSEYARYHDEEWGVTKTDDRALFEKIVLEGFQSGLSWLTILRKREHFRRAFDNFDAARI